MGFDIITASNHISDKYVRYLKTTFELEDPDYSLLFHQEMEKIGSFSKGPYLDVIDSFASGKSVTELIE